MKSVIIYYSYSGNTKKVADVLGNYLKQKGGVDIIELNALDESDKFLGQAKRAFLRKRAQIKPVNIALSGYDLICFGTPVWAFGPTPAMNTYLDKCSGAEGKNVVLFTTYGSGVGNQCCLDYMQNVLVKKGAKSFKQFSIQQGKLRDEQFVLSKIKEVVDIF